MKLPAKQMFLASEFAWWLLTGTIGLVSMLYMIELAQLNALELVLVGTALELGAFLFEVPTGVFADTRSRRLSVITGFFISGIAFMIMASQPVFWSIALGSFIWGIGWTFISGAHQAWLADEVGVLEAAPVYLQAQKVGSYASILAVFIAVPLGLVHLAYPILLAGVLLVGWSLVAFVAMAEEHFEPAKVTGFEAAAQTFTSGVRIVRGSSVLLLLMVVAVIVGAFSEGYDRLSMAHLLRDFDFPQPFGLEPVVIFGCLTLVGHIINIFLVRDLQARLNLQDSRRIALTLSWLTGGVLVSVMAFALTGQVWLAIALYVVISPLRRVCEPLAVAWMNPHIESSARATVLSLHSQADALGQIAGGPGVGVVGREFGLRVAIATSSLLLVPAIWLYSRHRAETEVTPP